MSRGPIIAAALVLLASLPIVGAGGGDGEPEYEQMSISMPRGDVRAGRKAFVDLHCTVCHRVYGDETLPPPVSALKGPLLGPSLSKRDPGSVATSVIAPSHSISTEILGEGVAADTGDRLSPMGDFTEVMTVRQMVDVVAYLRSIRD